MRTWLWPLLGIVLSAGLIRLYAEGWWALGAVMLLPWLLVLHEAGSWRSALLRGWAMSIALTLAVFSWFAQAVAAYTDWPIWQCLILLALLAPTLQPQVWVHALLRWRLQAWYGTSIAALGASAAWVGSEWLLPKLLGDTLGHGLAPALWLRQAADLGGAAGLSLILLLTHEALLRALLLRAQGWRRWIRPALLAIALPAALALYGVWRLDSLRAEFDSPVPALRVAMIQANQTDYEARRAAVGSYAVVREVLDAHFELSQAAIVEHGAEALLWSETVYPTPYGHPRSADGAALDREIAEFVEAAGVSLVFGSYDVDAAGEYNAAVFLDGERGLLGYYRKTHPFPLTEYVPAWLDGPLLRRWLPWAGSWRPGEGARVMPLRAADGRNLEVTPLICLDDVHPELAIQAARAGAQAIVGLSNDAWFSAAPIGAELHLAVASFRSIETRMPQLRVTSNGLSAFIDPSGEVLARTGMGDRAVLAGAVPIRNPPPTLMVRWGDWVGPSASLGVLLLCAWRAWPWLRRRMRAREIDLARPATVLRLTPPWYWLQIGLYGVAAIGLLVLLWPMWRDGFQVQSLRQIELYAALVLAPLLLAAVLHRWQRASLSLEPDQLCLQQRGLRIEIPLGSIVRLHPWRLSWPLRGVDLGLKSGARWPLGGIDAIELQARLRAQGATVPLDEEASAQRAAARSRAARSLLDHGLIKFGLFPLLVSLPAFRLHQVIAFGGTFGEYYTYGALAYFSGLGLWWAAWALGLMLYAALLRSLIEAIAAPLDRLRPGSRLSSRVRLEWIARALYFLGVPLWLGLRMLG